MPRHSFCPSLLPRKQAHQQVRLLEGPCPQHNRLIHPLNHPPASAPALRISVGLVARGFSLGSPHELRPANGTGFSPGPSHPSPPKQKRAARESGTARLL